MRKLPLYMCLACLDCLDCLACERSIKNEVWALLACLVCPPILIMPSECPRLPCVRLCARSSFFCVRSCALVLLDCLEQSQASQPASQPVSQPVSQPASQPVSLLSRDAPARAHRLETRTRPHMTRGRIDRKRGHARARSG